ncbi:NrfD/PsrC family molybdoenzyme membrane anchor subunit [Paraeggerthella sp. Marseille-Q4926]|uniref:NrfD/PsrC family molybdoenzyme membrane anchor subunit n=1 Tax=Paraeggerthella sp. Marseille-Q4926 TaxID=2866587 RepID=UPI001CE493D6|nr:NrfD/PsrC family molybdoenzyme membrane anchor subunit [Paraeggerthella sp. Marseille-Q4926]
MAFSDLIVLYLFLGGTAAGSFAVLSAVDLYAAFSFRLRFGFVGVPVGYSGHRALSATQERITKTGYSISFSMVVVGMLCLLADLGRPEAFYLLFLYPTGSFVSIGTFALTLFSACLAVALAQSVLALPPVWERIALAAKAVGMVLAVAVMVYTGMLLENVVAVGLWRSAWLPVLFLLSALSCGCGVVLLSTCFSEGYAGTSSWVKGLSVVDLVIVVFEAVVAVACAATVNAASVERPFDALLVGDQLCAFWFGFVGCGILIPLVIEASALTARKNHSSGVVAAMAVLLLVGGFCLRFVLVSAGVQTAV